MMIIKTRAERDYEIYQGLCRLRLLDDYDEEQLAIAEYYETDDNDYQLNYELIKQLIDLGTSKELPERLLMKKARFYESIVDAEMARRYDGEFEREMHPERFEAEFNAMYEHDRKYFPWVYEGRE